MGANHNTLPVPPHTGYRQAPQLVDILWSDLRAALPEIGDAPSIPQQTSLF